MMARRGRIAVLDDEPDWADAVREYLVDLGYDVDCLKAAWELEPYLAREKPDLVILDIGLPGENGIDILIRTDLASDVAVLVLTGNPDPVDRVLGLELGADDYVQKPVELRELLARIKSVLRRVKAAPASATPQAVAAPEGRSLRFGSLTLDLDARRLVDGSNGPVELTAMEFDLLQALATRPNRVLSRGQLQEFAHGRSADESDRSIDIRVTRLRKKIEPDPEHPRFIKTVRGEGYVFVPNGA